MRVHCLVCSKGAKVHKTQGASTKLFGSFVAAGGHNNDMFNRSSPNNRDNGFEATILLREEFARYGVELNTPDLNQNHSVAFELHLDARSTPTSVPKYLIRLETPAIHRGNGNSKLLAQYAIIFTWNDTWVNCRNRLKINFPNNVAAAGFKPWQDRDRFCCMIAGNKSVTNFDERELYSERVRTIRWFETFAPTQFDLYGSGWNYPPPPTGLAGKVMTRFWQRVAPVLKLRPFPAYRGRVDQKSDVLSNTKFSICYENLRDEPGYITEKIFDCFLSGCVPVYWGANNVTDHIPSSCFIDRRSFASHEALFDYLNSMSAPRYEQYQSAIHDFLSSGQAYPFSAACFADTLVDHIVKDLALES
jgi:alpha(1,3/1,4) fucosyltransferase